MVIESLAEGRILALPFAPALWLYAWCVATAAKRLTRTWPRWFKVPLFGGLFTAGLLAIVFGQIIVYRKMTGIRVLNKDDYFFALFLAEMFVGGALMIWLAYREQAREESGGTK